MNFIAQNALYIFVFIMVCVVAFDIFAIYYRIYDARKIKKLENKLKASFKETKPDSIDENFKNKLKKELKRTAYLIAFFSMVDHLSEKKRENYLDRIKDIIPSVYSHYEKRDVQKIIFLTYYFSKYPILCKDSDFLKQKMVTNCISKIVYLRENSLQTLYTLGDVSLIINAFYEMNLMNVNHNIKLITDGLLSFKGKHKELKEQLISNFYEYHDNLKIAVIAYLTHKRIRCEEFVYKVLSSKREDKEVKLACIRYFKAIRYDKVLPILFGFVENDKKEWELSVVSASALETYTDNKEVVQYLTNAITSHVYHLRKNAAKSLTHLISEQEIRKIIKRTNDNYAKDALEYQLRLKKEGEK